MKNFALVYLVENDPTGQLMDVGNDPCFDCPPSWGICRPDIRNEKEIGSGSRLLFIARIFVKSKRKYFVKGYFKVKNKINVIDAYMLFQNRQNIIISNKQRTPNNKWDKEDWKNYTDSKRNGVPLFLSEFKWNNQNYYQKESDKHGIDNWKCRRIFNCYLSTFKKCIDRQVCIKEAAVDKLKLNYILGDSETFKDWNKFRVEWKEISKLTGKSENLMRANKHPEIELSNEEMDKIVEYMNKKSIANNGS